MYRSNSFEEQIRRAEDASVQDLYKNFIPGQMTKSALESANIDDIEEDLLSMGARKNEIDNEFRCPLSQCIYIDPVKIKTINPSGETIWFYFERSYLMESLKTRPNINPVNKQPFVGKIEDAPEKLIQLANYRSLLEETMRAETKAKEQLVETTNSTTPLQSSTHVDKNNEPELEELLDNLQIQKNNLSNAKEKDDIHLTTQRISGLEAEIERRKRRSITANSKPIQPQVPQLLESTTPSELSTTEDILRMLLREKEAREKEERENEEAARRIEAEYSEEEIHQTDDLLLAEQMQAEEIQKQSGPDRERFINQLSNHSPIQREYFLDLLSLKQPVRRSDDEENKSTRTSDVTFQRRL